ncbi:MAG TPA: LamG domain-containing protein [Sedimentisphaerales bacterium]|nr:LamG domain-containing protein [Sedimentisphaerales bacterium]
MFKKLILLAFVLAVITAFSSVASALPLIGTVVRANGSIDDDPPIGPHDGSTPPLPTQAGGWINGNYVFSDRTYTWVNTPAQISGAEYVRTFNSDKGTSVTYTVTFPIGATVLLTADDRFTSQQSYVDNIVRDFAAAGEFTNTGWDVFVGGDSDRRLSVYSAVKGPGTYVFHDPASGSNNFYIIGALPSPVPVRKAYAPVPENGSRTPPSGEEGGGFWMLMTFTAGHGATTHTAYFSSNFDDVNDRSAAVSLGSPPYPEMFATGYYVGIDDPAIPEFARTPLDRGITYYWAVDESNSTSTYPGDVWSFTIASQTAWDPTPPDGAQYIKGASVVLAWQMGDVDDAANSVSYDVYWGTVEATVAADTIPDAHVTSATHTIGPLLSGTDYYWKVNTVLTLRNPPFTQTIIPGDVWQFTTRPFTDIIDDPTCVAWWMFDPDMGNLVLDQSGYDNDGTIIGGALRAPGRNEDAGNAIDLNGSSQYVNVPNSTSLSLTKDFTLAAWIHPDVVSGSHGIVTKLEGTSNKQYTLTFNNGELRFEYELSGNNYATSGGTVVTAGEWQHVAVTIDSLLLVNLYIDGVSVASETAPGEVLAQSNPVVIGRWSGSYNSNYFDGLIDDVQIYMRALSTQEIQVMAGRLSATNPDPADGATDVSRTPTLSWSPGAFAASVNGNIVYYSEDLSAVTNRTAPSATVTAPTFAVPGTLDLGTTFYWAVDTVNEPDTWPGELWRFSTIDWLPVDDMESYVPWTQSGDHIFEIWRDAFGDCAGSGNNSGSMLTENPDPVLGGAQSMKYDYDNDGTVYSPCSMGQEGGHLLYSKVEAQIAGLPSEIGTNWTIQGVKALSLQFYGRQLNGVEPMWVQLKDATKGYGSKVTYGDYQDEDPNAVTDESWHEWFIDMADFDVDLSNLVSISIGIGNEDGSGAHGNGIVYFDDFRLYAPRCMPSRHTAEMAKVDFAPVGAPDCVVNYKELDVMADDWLLTDVLETGELLVRWQFNETAGTTATDSSGKGRHGDVNDVNGVSWVNDAERGRCLDFAGGDYVLDNDANLYLNGLHGLTVAVWVKNRETIAIDQGFIIFQDPDGTDHRDIRYDAAGSSTGGTSVIKCGATIGTASSETWQEYESAGNVQTTAWQHVALTWSTGNDVKLYINGVEDATGPIQATLVGTTIGYNRVLVGKGCKDTATDIGWNGLIDDVQIYNHALSAAEIATVMAGGTIAPKPMHYPVPSSAEIYEGEAQGGRVINFKDYAELMDSWLLEIKYPQ